MNDDVTKTNLETALRVLPRSIRQKIFSATVRYSNNIQEVVLRAEKPVCVYVDGVQKFVTNNGCIIDSNDAQELVNTSISDVAECFNNVCGYSVYSHLNEIKEGFLTIRGGHRVGISGTAVISSDSIMNIRDISTISVRISRQIIGCAKTITEHLIKNLGGMLICGSPCSGKTTVIRDMARILSSDYGRRVSLVDTRGELAAVYQGVNQNDVGLCDVLNGYPRASAIEHSVRSLSPEFIICDEIGSPSDVRAIMNGVNSGVRFVATVHASTKEELCGRNTVRQILETDAFDSVVFLSGRDRPGRVSDKYTKDDILYG